MEVTLGTVVAERQLNLVDQPTTDVRVRIGMPQPFPGSRGDYYCPYQITGVGAEKVKYVGGVDSLQALEMVLLILPAELEVLARKHALRWEDAPVGEFGFSERLLAVTRDPGWGEELRSK